MPECSFAIRGMPRHSLTDKKILTLPHEEIIVDSMEIFIYKFDKRHPPGSLVETGMECNVFIRHICLDHLLDKDRDRNQFVDIRSFCSEKDFFYGGNYGKKKGDHR